MCVFGVVILSVNNGDQRLKLEDRQGKRLGLVYKAELYCYIQGCS